MKNFERRYSDLPKTEIHCHLEGSIRTRTVIDVAHQYHLQLPSYQIDQPDQHVKVFDQLQNLDAVLEALSIAQNSIASAAKDDGLFF